MGLLLCAVNHFLQLRRGKSERERCPAARRRIVIYKRCLHRDEQLQQRQCLVGDKSLLNALRQGVLGLSTALNVEHGQLVDMIGVGHHPVDGIEIAADQSGKGVHGGRAFAVHPIGYHA